MGRNSIDSLINDMDHYLKKFAQQNTGNAAITGSHLGNWIKTIDNILENKPEQVSKNNLKEGLMVFKAFGKQSPPLDLSKVTPLFETNDEKRLYFSALEELINTPEVSYSYSNLKNEYNKMNEWFSGKVKHIKDIEETENKVFSVIQNSALSPEGKQNPDIQKLYSLMINLVNARSLDPQALAALKRKPSISFETLQNLFKDSGELNEALSVFDKYALFTDEAVVMPEEKIVSNKEVRDWLSKIEKEEPPYIDPGILSSLIDALKLKSTTPQSKEMIASIVDPRTQPSLYNAILETLKQNNITIVA